MKRLVYLLCATGIGLVAFNGQAIAGNQIKVIHEDGSESVVDIDAPPAPQPAPTPKAPEPTLKIPPRESAPQPKLEAKPEPVAAPEPIAEPVTEPVAKPEQIMPELSAPKPREDAAPEEAVAEPVAEPPPRAMPKPVPLPPPKSVPAPAPKPKVAPKLTPKPAVGPSAFKPYDAEALEGQISEREARFIALDHAPPSSDVKVYQIDDFGGHPALAVVFKGDDGFFEVLLDPYSGDVLAARPSAAFTVQSAPGRLPALITR